jgi:thiamine-monophosphate kinase
MIDVSDGLLADLGHIAAASGVLIDVETARLELAAPLLAAARTLRHEPLDWVLSGGEDHALAATFPRDARLPSHWAVIGRVHEGQGMRVDGANYRGQFGWQHFR